MKLYVTNFIEDRIKAEAEVAGIRDAIYCVTMPDGELVFVIPKLDIVYTASEKEVKKFFSSIYFGSKYNTGSVYCSGCEYLNAVLESLGTTVEEVKESM